MTSTTPSHDLKIGEAKTSLNIGSYFKTIASKTTSHELQISEVNMSSNFKRANEQVVTT